MPARWLHVAVWVLQNCRLFPALMSSFPPSHPFEMLRDHSSGVVKQRCGSNITTWIFFPRLSGLGNADKNSRRHLDSAVAHFTSGIKMLFVIRLLLTSWNGSSPPNTDDQTRDANVPDIVGVAAEEDLLTLQSLREQKKIFLTPSDRKMKPGGSVLNLRSRLTVHGTTLFWDG